MSIGTNNQILTAGTAAFKYMIVAIPGGWAIKDGVAGQFASADNWGSNPLIANRASPGGWETFNITYRGNYRWSISANVNGRFVQVGSNRLLVASSSTPSTFTFEPTTPASTSWSLQIYNKVAPCAGGNYATIKLFLADYVQLNLQQGQTYMVNGTSISNLGLGIQENGMYCRCCGPESGCINPDNAGMQLQPVNRGDCQSFQLNDPFYCGAHPPNAKKFVAVALSGNWPNCVAVLTRLPNAPNCDYSC